MSKTKDIITLLDTGYMPYYGEVPADYYTDHKCRDSRKAEWFCRPAASEDAKNAYICMGCKKRCTAIDPKGWPLLLPIAKARPGRVAFTACYPLSADELLRLKTVLRVDEASYCLNLGVTTVYKMIDEGLLDTVAGDPIRVTSESVRRNLKPALR